MWPAAPQERPSHAHVIGTIFSIPTTSVRLHIASIDQKLCAMSSNMAKWCGSGLPSGSFEQQMWHSNLLELSPLLSSRWRGPCARKAIYPAREAHRLKIRFNEGEYIHISGHLKHNSALVTTHKLNTPFCWRMCVGYAPWWKVIW